MSPLAHERSLTWPPTTSRHATVQHKADDPPTSISAPAPAPQDKTNSLEDAINDHPESHFLASATMYEPWDDSDDEDGDEVEWSAGIMDFALYDSDRRAAADRKEELPERWDSLIASQRDAMQRAERRQQSDDEADEYPVFASAPELDELPSLTPDISPALRDDLEFDAQPLHPNVPKIILTSPDEHDKQLLDGANNTPYPSDADIAADRLARRRLERPGMLYSRTWSGKLHVWRRPSQDLGTVYEEPTKEEAQDGEQNLDLSTREGRYRNWYAAAHRAAVQDAERRRQEGWDVRFRN